jgi:hypothetical protein
MQNVQHSIRVQTQPESHMFKESFTAHWVYSDACASPDGKQVQAFHTGLFNFPPI